MTAAILVNGREGAWVSPLDRGLAFGDGVFRTLKVRRGRPCNWDRHYHRLAADCLALNLEVPAEPVLRTDMAAVAPGDATVKIMVTRGAPTHGRGYSLAPGAQPTRIVAAFPPPDYPPELARDGVRVRRCTLVLAEQPALAGVKTLNRLENVLARAEWSDPSIREGLLADRNAYVIEGTMSNLFLVRDGTLATPDLARCGVAGAQRERVRELAAGAGIACVVREIAFTEVAQADEVFLTNSLIGLWPVAALEARQWTPGPVTRALQALVEAEDA